MEWKLLQWLRNNKLLVLFMALSFCLFISTVALARKRCRTSPGPMAAELHSTPQRRTPQDSPLSSPQNSSITNLDNINHYYYRLPRHIKPLNYSIILRPNLTSLQAEGLVTITMDVLKSSKNITLHSNNLTIESVTVKNKDDQNVVVANVETSGDKREFLIVNLESEIQKGNHTIIIEFKENLRNKIVGFYGSSLKRGGTMVASKFQPTYARQAFPCFDEPNFKATFDITLVKPASYVALSNMNEVSKTPVKDPNNEAVTFATSVPMSTYLACFVVCDFDFKETKVKANNIGHNFKLRSYAQKDQMHKIDFAQDIGKRATEFYIQYYEVPFPLPKLDMIAIPDYQSGATEHWGLITYRETSFLVDEATASARNKIAVANTIAHELAHMWFGNLVTMKWWDEIWLNEGFATYMQVKSLNAIEPSWTMLDQFLTKTLHTALSIDAKLSSHPIVQVVETPDQITSIFDSISYNKGSSILRMLEGFIGEENFRRGVSDYLKTHEFSNTVTQDLYQSLEPYFKKDNPSLNLTYIMDTWTRQMGYPVLTVQKGDAPNTYKITQSRFLLDPDAVYTNDSPFEYCWFIPITYKTNKGSNDKILWFPDVESNVILQLKEGENWVKINNNQVGFYRVNYPREMWESLIEQLKNKSDQLTISDRTHLLNDVFALAESRAVPYDVALSLTLYLRAEEDYVPWTAAFSIFAELSDRLLNSEAYEHLKKYVQSLVKPLYDKQSWDKTDIGVMARLFRSTILTVATKYEVPAAQTRVRDIFLSWLHDHGKPNATDIEPDLRDFVYYYGMKSATLSEWEKLWSIYLKEEDAQEQTKLREALAAPSDVDILRKYLKLSWDEKYIRSQDYFTVLKYISMNPLGASLVWDDVRNRWPQLVDRFTLNSRYLGALIPGITEDFSTDTRLTEMSEFFAKYPEAGAGETARRRALETVRNNILWATTHQSTVALWLKTNTSPAL